MNTSPKVAELEQSTSKTKSCCGAKRGDTLVGTAAFVDGINRTGVAAPEVQQELRDRQVVIPGGFFEMGARKSTFPADQDSPRRKVRVAPFTIAPCAVTNTEFAAFVADTGYKTVAEQEGWSYVFHLLLEDASQHPLTPPGQKWWRVVEGATWSAPEGPGSDVSTRGNHPVVHMAWFDAMAYCRWAGLRLPCEAEWERAARGGLARKKFPWGNGMTPDGAFAMNTWQGQFPDTNTQEDGYLATAPVDAFSPNGYGLYNTTGNVWEWVRDAKGPLPKLDGIGAECDTINAVRRIQRGGSFLCHISYCDRYHIHSRTTNDPDSSTSNAGFRVAF